MPKASYSLTNVQKQELCNWIRNLRMPDGYASNISHCVKGDCEFYGMKSHDCHIFMQRLLSIAFKELLPKPIWEALIELSHFFRDICSPVLRIKDMEQLEQNIVVTLCKLEKIFQLGFFDSIEHLSVHLAYEAKVGGPMQYRWIYPFERFIHHLKKEVKNWAHVEASIVEAYLVEEMSTFCSLYFDQIIQTRLNRVLRNDDGGHIDSQGRLSIFTYLGRPFGMQRHNSRLMTNEEFRAASTYVLFNCEEVTLFIAVFDKHMRMLHPQMYDGQFDGLREEHFSCWLKEYETFDVFMEKGVMTRLDKKLGDFWFKRQGLGVCKLNF
ncbi:uncharacterized protein LOC111407911 isoform X1 [Olea europaea var. sylvestris]|uniref:uncharacterized protein LOC111407911 isoform X1 n=1 Tax=Olea europaea var. sylvestris TaxID=158386 RepID=UPI000C1D0CB4|nr:uncharacterized protein LOC111407911 isoform X1 [Olea europaea var. sylvestris]XP_022893392.1 uncharacterized protein LOC111407911 isoform X1 [Olea europaea var. sylvestris]